MDELKFLTSQRFKLGNFLISAQELLGWPAIQQIKSKFKHVGDETFAVTLRELIRFFYLAAHSPSSVFFPGNQLMDDMWHTLVMETASYRELCNKIRLGVFLDHSSISFSEYTVGKTGAQINEEQCSWLASYVANFGALELSSFDCLSLAQSLCERMNCDLQKLNEFAAYILKAAKDTSQPPFDFDSYVENNVKPQAPHLDRDSYRVSDCIREILAGAKLSHTSEEPVLPTPVQLEKLFSVSTALAFTMAQHVSAVDRLSELPDWQLNNKNLWKKIANGELLCGLATTNLGKPCGAGVQAIETENGFTLTGTAPWVCGYGLFDVMVLGFETQDSVIFTLIEAPHPLRPSSLDRISAVPYRLACLNGSATYKVTFLEKEIPHDALISRKLKGGKVIPRPSRYLIPELGMAIGAMEATQQIASSSVHPRQKFVREALVGLNVRLNTIREKRDANASTDELNPLRDELIRDANRLLVLATGAAALSEGSLASRLQLEFMLMDVVIQTPAVLARKAQLTSLEKNG